MKKLLAIALASLPLATVYTTAASSQAQAIAIPSTAMPSDGGAPVSAAQASAIAATVRAQAAADTAASVAAATPTLCLSPSADTINGSAGTGERCMPRQDQTRPSVVQPISTTTSAACTWAVTFPRALTTLPSYVSAEPQLSPSAAPDVVKCNVVASQVTATGAGGYCSASVATTLGSTLLTLAGTIIRPMACSPSAQGVTVKVLVRDPAS